MYITLLENLNLFSVFFQSFIGSVWTCRTWSVPKIHHFSRFCSFSLIYYSNLWEEMKKISIGFKTFSSWTFQNTPYFYFYLIWRKRYRVTMSKGFEIRKVKFYCGEILQCSLKLTEKIRDFKFGFCFRTILALLCRMVRPDMHADGGTSHYVTSGWTLWWYRVNHSTYWW